MKALVTGATGFIGEYVIGELLHLGHQVMATSSNEEKARSRPWFSQVGYKSLDFKNLDPGADYFSYFNKPDLAIHLAWEGLPDYKADFHLSDNLPRHKAFLDNLIQNGLKDLTVTGTCLEYGMQEGCLAETMEPQPGNAYAKAKNQLRLFLEKESEQHDLHLKWVRLFYMYGKGQNPKSLLSQLDRAIKDGLPVFNMSGGEQVRDYLPVETVASNIVKIAVQNRVEGVINCCSNEPKKVKDLVLDYIRSHNAGVELNLGYYPYPDYEPMRFWGDNKKLKTIIDND